MPPSTNFSKADLAGIRRSVLAWYRKNGRVLPWRGTSDPYKIWVSEIMLQQTTIATVLGHYQRFLDAFPTVAHLAEASLEEVLHHWQGLGYYRRARAMHAAACQVMSHHAGVFPTDEATLASLPGLGRYTANAIACFSTHKSLPIIEANTRRLWSRVLGRAGDPTKPPLANDLWQLAEAALPSRSPADFNQSAMDIGSTICTPTRPACDRCPLVRFCRSFRDGTVGQIPTRVAKRAVVLRTDVSVVVWDHPRRRLLVTQRAPEGQWGGLWEFPRIECRNDETLEEAVPKALRCATTQPARILGTGPIIRHSIMHYRVTLHVVEVQITSTRQQRTSTPRRWISVNELLSLPWSTPQRKIARWLSQRESSNATTP